MFGIDTHAEEWLACIDAVLELEACENECADRNSKIIADDLYKRLAEAEQKERILRLRMMINLEIWQQISFVIVFSRKAVS